MQPDSNWLDLTGSFFSLLAIFIILSLVFLFVFFCISVFCMSVLHKHWHKQWPESWAGHSPLLELACHSDPGSDAAARPKWQPGCNSPYFFLSSPLISPLKVLNMMQYSLPSCYQKAPKSECLKNQAILWSLFWCGLSEHYYVSGSLDSHGMRPIFHNSWFIPPLITRLDIHRISVDLRLESLLDQEVWE